VRGALAAMLTAQLKLQEVRAAECGRVMGGVPVRRVTSGDEWRGVARACHRAAHNARGGTATQAWPPQLAQLMSTCRCAAGRAAKLLASNLPATSRFMVQSVGLSGGAQAWLSVGKKKKVELEAVIGTGVDNLGLLLPALLLCPQGVRCWVVLGCCRAPYGGAYVTYLHINLTWTALLRLSNTVAGPCSPCRVDPPP
jgi:hypothetical protein